MSADWELLLALSAAPTHHWQTGWQSNMPWQLWLVHQPHCWLSGHHSVFHHQLPHQPHHPSGGRLVITPTPLSVDWSPLQHTLLAAPSAPPPHCRPTGRHSNIPCWLPHHPHHPTVGQLVTPPTPLSADWSPLQHPLSAAPSSPPPHCQPTGHHSNIPCRPTRY